MIGFIFAAVIIGTSLESDLTLNKRIEVAKEDKFKFGTPAEIEEANKWANRVYLATFPRSGNHWVRYLIEEATGVTTSSVYKDPDPDHLEYVFPWGGYCCDHGYEGVSRYPMEGETVVVKTHFPSMEISRFSTLPYKKTIRIIRHPVDSFYSYYLWIQNFRGKASEHMIPRGNLREFLQTWRKFQEFWDSQENVITIRYEDLFLNPLPYLRLIIEKMGYQVTDEDLKRAVEKYPPKGSFLKHIDHYTERDLSLIQTELKDLLKTYRYGLKKIMPLEL